MKRYCISIYRPDGYDPSVEEDETIRGEIDALNTRMVTAGVRVFVGGLTSPDRAKALRRQDVGSIVTTDGTYLRAGEHVGGFWVLSCADLDSALDWGKQAAIACRASVEVRPFNE